MDNRRWRCKLRTGRRDYSGKDSWARRWAYLEQLKVSQRLEYEVEGDRDRGREEVSFLEHTYWITESEWIPSPFVLARANRAVIVHAAFRVSAANVRCARVHTFLVDARFVERAFRGNDTLWSTVRALAFEAGRTRANGDSIVIATLAVRSARTRTTRIDGFVLNG